jgi:hypothetical protein
VEKRHKKSPGKGAGFMVFWWHLISISEYAKSAANWRK